MMLQTILRNLATKSLRPITSYRKVQNVFNRTRFATTSNRFYSDSVESATTPLANSPKSTGTVTTPVESTLEEHKANSTKTAETVTTRVEPALEEHIANSTKSAETVTTPVEPALEEHIANSTDSAETVDTIAESTFEEHIANSTDANEPVGTIAEPTFEELLLNSKLMKFGRFQDKVVVGKIVDVCNDDLYIDFGGKFEYVGPHPKSDDPKYYKKGNYVRLVLFRYEMTGKFLGDDMGVTVCEALGRIVGPLMDVKPEFVKVKDNAFV